MSAQNPTFPVTSEMAAMGATAEQRGLVNGIDFYVRGLPFPGQLGADLVGLSFDGAEYTVEYRGTDRTRELLRTTDFATASERFLHEAAQTAARFADRRPALPSEPAASPPTSPWAVPRKVLTGCFAGLLAGVFALPLVLVFVVLRVAGSGESGSSSKTRPQDPSRNANPAPSRGGRWRRLAGLKPRGGGDAVRLSDWLQAAAFAGCFVIGLGGVCFAAWLVWLK
jgi:hypothetical protein